MPTQVRRPYTAPERTGGSEWGRRADVFGLAALIHEMLWARRVAGTAEQAAGSLTEIAGGDLPRLREVFGRALAEDPAERFGRALEFAGALEEAFLVRSVRLQPDRVPTVRLKADTMYETPLLQFEAAAEENAEKAVEEESEPVVMRTDLDLKPPVVPPELIDSYRPPPDGILAEERSRSAISPLAFALVIGAALGFAAGFGVCFCSPGASTRRTIGVFSLYLRSLTFPLSSFTRRMKTGSVPSLSKFSLVMVTGSTPFNPCSR